MSFPNLAVPKLIYSSSSPHNKKIEVYQVGVSRRLSVNDTVQSISRNSRSVYGRVWGKLIGVVEELRPNAKSVLIFGLGGGTMAHLINEKLPGVTITIVEIDTEMIKVAKDFFELNEADNLRVINADAMRVVSEPEEFKLENHAFDVVIVDIYCGNEFPELAASGNFLAGIKNLTRSNGLVVFNRIYIRQFQQEVNQFMQTLGTYFKNVKSRMVAGHTNSDNIIIYGEAN